MTTPEIILQVNAQLGQRGRNRFFTGTTTGAGNAAGTTFVSTGLTGVDDAYNEMEFKITSGDLDGQIGRIGDWVNSTNTGSLIEPMETQIPSGVTFEIGEKGVVSDIDIIDYINNAQENLATHLVPDVFAADLIDLEIAMSAGVASAVLPDTYAGVPNKGYFKTGSSVNYDIEIIPIDRKNMIRRNPFKGQTVKDIVVWFQNQKAYMAPGLTGTLVFPVVPNFTDVSYSVASTMPSFVHYLLVIYAVWHGWEQKRDFAKAADKKTEYYAEIEGINNRYANNAKLVM